MSFVLLGILNSQASGGAGVSVFRFQKLGGAGTEIAYSFVDSAGSGIFSGFSNDISSLESGYVASIAPDGTSNWARSLRSATTQVVNYRGQSLGSDGSIYLSGRSSDLGITQYGTLVVKYDSDGSIQWQKGLTHESSGNMELYAGVVDSSDNVIASGTDGDRDGLLIKYDSSGNLVFQKEIDLQGANELTNLTIDASDNIYCSAYGGLAENEPHVIKLNSLGVVQWARAFDVNGRAEAVAVDASGNVYLAGRSESSDFAHLSKFNSSGTLQWQKNFEGETASNQFYGLQVDSNGDIFVTGRLTETRLVCAVIKVDSSGNVIWQRAIRGGANILNFGLSLDANENPMVAAYDNDDSVDMFGGLVPSDGSLTANYPLDGETIEYFASSFSVTTPTYSVKTITPSVSSSSHSQVTSTSLDEAGTLPVQSVQL